MTPWNVQGGFGKRWQPPILLGLLTIVVLVVSVVSLQSGWQTIFQNLFYFPIIFACIYYVKRGFVFSVLLAFGYFGLMAAFSQDPGVLEGALIRVLIFILVAAVITYLSLIRIRAEQASKESERRLTAIIDFLPDPTFAIDPSGTVISWNRAIEEMTGVPKSAMIGMGNFAYSIPLYGKEQPALVDFVLDRDGDQARKYTHITRTGNKVIAEVFAPGLNKGRGEDLWMIASPLYGAGGERTGAIESIRIITERKRAEEAYKEANKKLMLLSSITRHDINNQVCILQSYLMMLQNKIQDPADETLFSRITKSGQRISSMIQFTKSYEEIGVKAPAWHDTSALVDRAAANLALGSVQLINDIPAGSSVFADPLIEKVFFNLMDNAVKYGDTITTLRFSLRETGENNIVVCEDNGVGVPSENKEMIFERGFGKNTGLGLFLAREILAITGITIRETGEPAKGARFEMIVPKSGFRFIE